MLTSFVLLIRDSEQRCEEQNDNGESTECEASNKTIIMYHLSCDRFTNALQLI